MTKVEVIKPDQKKMIPLSEGYHGAWYKIAKYEPNPHLQGEVGIFLSKRNLGLRHNSLLTPNGICYSSESIFIEELSEVVITVKE
jgi:hypothetical protein